MTCQMPVEKDYVSTSMTATLGFDLVQISAIDESIRQFGDAFKNRLFTAGELAYAHSGTGLCSERLASRFAAKEAVIKALNFSDSGIGWRDIEVLKNQDGDCFIDLHGRATELAVALGMHTLKISLSHDGDYAGAVVIALFVPVGKV